MSALGLICKDDDGNGILQALKSIRLSELLSKNIIRIIINVCIRTTRRLVYMKMARERFWPCIVRPGRETSKPSKQSWK